MKYLFLSIFLFSQISLADEIYEFKSPFTEGVSDVAYSGQTTRQVLINSLKVKMGSIKSKGLFETGEEGAYAVLNTYVDYKPEPKAEEVLGGFYGYSPLYFQLYKTQRGVLKVKSEFDYDESANAPDENKLVLDYIFPETTANLVKKVAGNDNELVHGEMFGFNGNFVVVKHSEEEEAYFKDASYEQTPDNFLKYMMALWAEDAGRGTSFVVEIAPRKFERVNKVGVLANGWDLTQLTQKFLHGALSFSQAARDYLSTDLGEAKGINADNTKPAKPGRAYTALAHHWDEAFGYFGASRDYLALSKKEIKSGYSFDADLDHKIDVKSEVNFGLSVNAAKRDLGASGTEQFTESIFNNFVKGRALISNKPEGYRDSLKVVADEIVNEWERLFVANTIHYINKVISEYQRFNSEEGMSFLQLSKFWGEMKGFSLALQFNPNSVMSIEEFKNLQALFRVQPELRREGFSMYILKLKQARLKLGKTYNFDLNAIEKM